MAGSGAVEGYVVEPGIQADEVERGGADNVLKVGFGQAAVTGVAGIGDRDTLTDGAFHPGTEPVGPGETFGVLPGPGR